MLGIVGGILVAVGTAVTAIDGIINKNKRSDKKWNFTYIWQ